MKECQVIEEEEGEIFDEATPEDIEAIIGSDFADSEKSPTWSTTAPMWSPSRRPSPDRRSWTRTRIERAALSWFNKRSKVRAGKGTV